MSLAEIVKKKPNKENRKHTNKTLSNEEFVNLSKSIFGEKRFTYKSEYVNTRTYFTLLCNVCNHEFSTRYYNHILRQDNCPKCSIIESIEKKRKVEEKKFLEKAKKIHDNRYNYDKVDYINSSTKVIIVCENLHEYLIAPYHHLAGRGCIYCSKELKKKGKESLNVKVIKKPKKIWTKELFIEESKKIFGDKYDYSLVEFINMKTAVKIKCPKGHIYNQLPSGHIKGKNCFKCGVNEWTDALKLTNEEFIERSKDKFGKDAFDYSLVDYKTSKDYITLICKKKKHKFDVKAGKHISGAGCPLCKNKSEIMLYDILHKYYENIIYQKFFKDIEIIKINPFDICLEDFKIIVEVDGEQHFKYIEYFKGQTLEERQEVDFLKMLEISKIGYSIIRIYQPDILLKTYDWLNIIIESVNFIKQKNKSCLITIEKNKLVYNTYVNNYKNFVLSKNENLIDYYFINNLDDINNINEENINKEEDINEEFYEIYEPSEYDPEDYIVPYEFDSDYEDNRENIDEFYSEDYYTSECYFRKMEKLAKLNLNK